MKILTYIAALFLICLTACQSNKTDNISDILKAWENKEILLPKNVHFTVMWKDTVDNPITREYRILSYVDTIGCVSCKLHFSDWKKTIAEFDSICGDKVQFLFYLCPEHNNQVFFKLKSEGFYYPVCIDEKNQIEKLNHFPQGDYLHTFLLDSTNRVIAIGDPVQNPEIKRLYLNIITGKAPSQKEDIPSTTILLDKPFIDFGVFPWKEEQKAKFIIKNTGNESLVIKDIITSCDCTTVSYKKEPVPQNGSLEVEITFKAEHPEVFERDITVYCNANNAPVEVTVKGEAK